MGARNVLNTHFSYRIMGSVNEFMSQRLFNFCLSVSTYLLPLFGFISAYFVRLKRKDNSLNCNSISLCQEICENNSSFVEAETGEGFKENGNGDSKRHELFKEETTEFCLKFKFPTFEEFIKNIKQSNDSVNSEAMPSATSASISKYEFVSEKSFSAFIEELEPTNCRVEEVNTDINDVSLGNIEIDHKKEGFSDEEFNSPQWGKESVHEETEENSINDVTGDDLIEKNESVDSTNGKGEEIDKENDVQASNESETSIMGSDLEWNDKDDFLSDGDFGGVFELDYLMDIDGQKVESHEEMTDSEESLESEDFGGEDGDIMEELREMEEDHKRDSNEFKSNFLSAKDFLGVSDNFNYGGGSGSDDKSVKNSEIPGLKISSSLDSEDANKLETLWEHQDLIEQLKMELKKVRATGLPTILEESESPKITDDLKPWKIDEKFQHENPMGELHKFYKSYRERMRKFDILTYQKMYAIGFLQLKDPLEPFSTKKTSVADIATTISESLYVYKKSKKDEDDLTKKFIKELQSDLEVVYVGQMCLSWEVLHWQYGMALDLWNSDPRRICRYNEVAGEFQQFQVLIQRFIEDEPFQGPRVQNYIKHRCVLRNLLQVPVIREDIPDGRKMARKNHGGDYSITSDMLVEIVEESIRLFWRFVRADKDCNITTLKNRKGVIIDLQDPADSEILMEVRKDLQKKERKLKDQLRSSNCILKKFRRCGEEDSSTSHDPVLYFFSQVDMKLVGRVLNMSRLTTDQLAWCRNKLSTISFINRKVHVEPSFCLFPC